MNTLDAIKNRRTVYALGRGSLLTPERILALIKEATDYVPSAFNSQSQRVVLLSGAAHDKLWEIVLESLRKIVPAEKFKKTEDKINGFAKAEGTILFFDDVEVTNRLIQAFPSYADNFVPWAEQQNGMLQFAIWSLLEEQGLGVNIQHYNPLIDQEVMKNWGLSPKWKLRAEMVYGRKVAEPDPREHQPIETRVLSFDK
jgi:uncharacterized protein